MVIGAQQEQVLYRVAVVARQRADLHLVQRGGYGGHGILAQRQPQQPGKFLAVHLRVAQQLHKLIQHIAKDMPYLSVFLRCLCLPGIQQFLLPPLQYLRCTGILSKSVKRFCLTPNGFIGFYPLAQGQKQRTDLPPQAVDLRQLIPAVGGHFTAVAVWVGRPVRVAEPHIAPYLPADGVILQQVAFLRRQVGHASLQAAEHVLVLKAACDGVHGGQKQRQDGLLQNIAAAADVGGDLIAAEHGLQQRAVDVHIAGGHGHIPPADAVLRQLSQLGGDIFHLGIGRMRLVQRDGRRVPLPGLVRAEEVLFKMGKRRVRIADKVLHFTAAAAFFCQLL